MSLFDDGDLLFLHEPVRLQLMFSLAGADCLDFVFLHNATGISKGNLSVQMSRLGERGWVESEKRLRNNRPCTEFRLTRRGRRVLTRYRKAMQSLLSGASEAFESD